MRKIYAPALLILVAFVISSNCTAATSPDDLIGQYVATDHGRLEISTSSIGRIYSPGSSDPFSYTYTVTGADTGDLTISFDDGIRVDVFSLTFVESRSGTYLLDRLENGVPVEEDLPGDFSTGRNRNVTDLKMGESLGELVGNDIYNGSGARQTFRDRERASSSFTLLAELENDGGGDTIRVRGTKGRKKFGVTYFAINPRRNITAAMITGRLRETLAAGESSFYQILVEPRKDRGSIVLHVSGRSATVPGAGDRAKAKIKLKKGRR